MTWLDIAKLAGVPLLMIVAFVLVWRGMRAPPHNKGNIRGGGAGNGSNGPGAHQ